MTNPATDIIVAKAGAVLTLETDRILANTKLVEVKPTATAPNSTFEGLTLQMEGWSKGTSLAPASTQPMAAPQPVAAYQPITQSAPPKPIIPAAPQPLPTYQPPAPPVAPYTPPMVTSTDYTPPMMADSRYGPRRPLPHPAQRRSTTIRLAERRILTRSRIKGRCVEALPLHLREGTGVHIPV